MCLYCHLINLGPYARRKRIAIALLLLISVFCLPTVAQEWRSFSPPDRRFTISAPGLMTEVGSFDGEHGVWNERDPNDAHSKSYAVLTESLEESRYGIRVVPAKSEPETSKLRSASKTLEYLGQLYIGDEDETQFMKPAVRVTRNGITGRDYIYTKVSESNSQFLFTRGRIFAVGNRFYIVIYRGKNETDLRSAGAERFLNSFRLRRMADRRYSDRQPRSHQAAKPD